MKVKSLREKLIAFLIESGYVEEGCKSSKYRMFAKANSNYFFVGTHGGLRYYNLPTASKSFSCGPKAMIMQLFTGWCKRKDSGV